MYSTGCVFSFPLCVYVQSLRHAQLLATLWNVAHKASLPMVFSRQEYWSELPFPLSGDLLDPGIKLSSPISPLLQTDSLF